MDYDSDDNLEDDHSGMLRKALDVELPKNFDPNSIPQTGEEYLHHVIYERTKKCEDWITADKDFTKYKNNQTVHVAKDKQIEKPLAKFFPTKEWQEKCMADFNQLKIYLSNSINDDSKKASRMTIGQIEETPVKLSTLAKNSQANKIRMLEEITDHLEDFNPVKGISENLGGWIYGILALLEKPLTPDCCFILREFAKKCANLRASLREDADENVARPFNLYICIIARHFNQLDLADE